MSGVFQHHPFNGFLVYFIKWLNERLQRDRVNKGFSKNRLRQPFLTIEFTPSLFCVMET
jgi:hypothetical protein